MDWFKAFLIGIVLVVGLLAIPIILTVLIPVLAFIVVIGVIYFLLKVIKYDDG